MILQETIVENINITGHKKKINSVWHLLQQVGTFPVTLISERAALYATFAKRTCMFCPEGGGGKERKKMILVCTRVNPRPTRAKNTEGCSQVA